MRGATLSPKELDLILQRVGFGTTGVQEEAQLREHLAAMGKRDGLLTAIAKAAQPFREPRTDGLFMYELRRAFKAFQGFDATTPERR